MHFHVVTLFPELFASVIEATMLKKGRERGAIDFTFHDIRTHATDKHRVTDDTPYGGGAGMVMKPEPLVAAIEATGSRPDRPHRVLLTPQGAPLHAGARARARGAADVGAGLRALRGRRRARARLRRRGAVDRRLRPLGRRDRRARRHRRRRAPRARRARRAESADDESFSDGLLEYPQYTRPPEFRGERVPEILALRQPRRDRPLAPPRVAPPHPRRRPDLLERAALSAEDRRILDELKRK